MKIIVCLWWFTVGLWVCTDNVGEGWRIFRLSCRVGWRQSITLLDIHVSQYYQAVWVWDKCLIEHWSVDGVAFDERG